MDSQETVGVSPELFHEFCFPLLSRSGRDVRPGLLGLLRAGRPDLGDLAQQTAPSESRLHLALGDQRFMAEALDGKGIVFSRKPNPNLLGVDVHLNEDAWAAEDPATLEITAGKNIPLEFVVRDVYSMHGNLAKARRAVEIANHEIDQFFLRGK